jgi:pilus assembly protein Flp/PilA
MRGLMSRFLSDQSGATAIEYCLIATGIAFAIIATVQGIGPQLNTKFTLGHPRSAPASFRSVQTSVSRRRSPRR